MQRLYAEAQQSMLAGERADRGAAMLLVLTLMVVLTGVVVMLSSALASQGPAVHQAERSSQTVYAAQSGMQIALGQLRSAVTAGYGDRSKLPCTVDGAIDSSDGASAYTVEVRYYREDPTERTPAWRDNSANFRTCSTLTFTPHFALLTARAEGAPKPGLDDAAGNRALQAVYAFKVSNVNIPGGRIFNYEETHCLVAPQPAVAGSKISYRPATECMTLPDARTMWVYDTDYRIKLAATIASTPLCITAMNESSTRDAELQPCRSSTDSNRRVQLWNWGGNYSWEGQRRLDQTGQSSVCLAPPDGYHSLTGQPLQARVNGCGPNRSFSPTPEVGAGAASYDTRQLVNYLEFGRCADVTDTDINKSFMIAYPCKQDASGLQGFDWNHKWYYSEPPAGQVRTGTQQIYVQVSAGNSGRRCLVAPAANSSTRYVTFANCSTSSAAQRWIRHGDTGSYATSYLFTDHLGRCLDVNQSDTYSTWSKMVVRECSSSLSQKWNAPSQTTDSTLGGYRELG
ncbi:RICIN domain-containing protein [Salinibacterium sp. ZJ70]|uniref:RICIN domain-containing protein n=1 Tax=Salinibacterium sp. ZJ70 TaxID=2708084 RepID=UPI00141D8DBC|nr:RICIN domain-containing protein [Salinibacterium sp. ZJ70]